jgi:hypothetical protein
LARSGGLREFGGGVGGRPAHGLAVSNLSLTAGGSTATATATVENNGSSSITIPKLELRGKRATDPSGNAMSPVA